MLEGQSWVLQAHTEKTNLPVLISVFDKQAPDGLQPQHSAVK